MTFAPGMACFPFTLSAYKPPFTSGGGGEDLVSSPHSCQTADAPMDIFKNSELLYDHGDQSRHLKPNPHLFLTLTEWFLV